MQGRPHCAAVCRPEHTRLKTAPTTCPQGLSGPSARPWVRWLPGISSLPKYAMSGMSRKRLRDAADAPSAGDSGEEAYMQLGRSIATALQEVEESAETACAELRNSRLALHEAIDSRCDELEAGVRYAAASKIASLEQELVAVETSLARWKAEDGGTSSRTSDAGVQMGALPAAVREPPLVGLLSDDRALFSSITGFGRALAPLQLSTAAPTSLGGSFTDTRPAEFGVSGTDESLVRLSKAITGALESVTGSTEAAHVQLRSSRAALYAAIDARCDELAAGLDSAKVNKVASLERELVTVDAALELCRSKSGAMQAAAASLAEIEALRTTLSFNVEDAGEELRALLSSIAGFGRVLAPLPIAAADLCLEDPGVLTSTWPGDTLSLRLSLGARHAAQSAEELEVSLGRAAESMRVVASLEGPGGTSPLQATVARDTAQRCMLVTIVCPADSADGQCVVISGISVAGQTLQGLPLNIPVRGLDEPLELVCPPTRDGYQPACISSEGCVYICPTCGSEVLIFGPDGASLPGLPIASLGFSGRLCAAFADGDAPSLLLGDEDSGRLVALNPATRQIRWETDISDNIEVLRLDGLVARPIYCCCEAITVLPTLGILVACYSEVLVARRLSDGAIVGHLSVPGIRTPSGRMTLAADPLTGTVYGTVLDNSTIRGDCIAVSSWSCSADGESVRMTQGRLATLAGRTIGPRPLAVVPPAPGKRVSYLVVGSSFYSELGSHQPELRVLSLPGLALVHCHELEDIDVASLAADPCGRALVAHDRDSQISYVLPWPLPGMPPLE